MSLTPDPLRNCTHTQDRKKTCEMFGPLLHREGESMNADSPRSCPPVAAGMEKQGYLAEGVNEEANPAPPSPSQLCCTSRLPRGYTAIHPCSPHALSKNRSPSWVGGFLSLREEPRACCDVHLRRGARRKGTQE